MSSDSERIISIEDLPEFSLSTTHRIVTETVSVEYGHVEDAAFELMKQGKNVVVTYQDGRALLHCLTREALS